MDFQRFKFKSLDEITNYCEDNNINIGFSNNLEVLSKAVKVNGVTIPNSLAIHPMEGCDGNEDGTPGELTIRRYERFAKGGSGLLWFEAVAVVKEGKANPYQLSINKDNVDSFKEIYNTIQKSAKEVNGEDFSPVSIMQLTHSGRFSRPNKGKADPILECRNDILDRHQKIKDVVIITDEQLEDLENKFVDAALLAKEAGFNGVDVKACHRYLNSGLLSAFTRNGKYGGDFEGRTRFLVNTVKKIRKAIPEAEFLITSRLNIYDAIPHPYGFGVDRTNYHKMDLTEPIKLLKVLYKEGVSMINITMGTPYYNPHVNRPYDQGEYTPIESALEGVARLFKGARSLKAAVPEMIIVGTGYTYLKEFLQNAAAYNVENNFVDIVGVGRMAFAYPDYANDIIKNGGMVKQKCCIACGKCTEIMRHGGTTGCLIKDAKVYAPIYKKYCS